MWWLILPALSWGQSSLKLQWEVQSNRQHLAAPTYSRQSPSLAVSDTTLSPTPQFLPRYARENPTGYSFLCRQELAIQRRWPVGLWVDMEDNPNLQGQIMTTPHLRLQVPLK